MATDPIAQAAYNAGFRGKDLVTAIAIALAEGGSSSSTNNTLYPSLPGYKPPAAGAQPEYSVGPWQINLSAHPDITEVAARNPQGAANYAYGLATSGNGFSNWSQYSNGAYQQFLDRAKIATGGLPSDALSGSSAKPAIYGANNGPRTTANDVGDAVGGAIAATAGKAVQTVAPWSDGLGHILSDLRDTHWWAKSGITVAAIALIAAGLLIYVQKSPQIRSAETAVAKDAAV